MCKDCLPDVLISGNFCHIPSSHKFYIRRGSSAEKLIKKIHYVTVNAENPYQSLVAFESLTGLTVKILKVRGNVKIFLDQTMLICREIDDEHSVKTAIRDSISMLLDKDVFKYIVLKAIKLDPQKFEGVLYS